MNLQARCDKGPAGRRAHSGIGETSELLRMARQADRDGLDLFSLSDHTHAFPVRLVNQHHRLHRHPSPELPGHPVRLTHPTDSSTGP
jgi:hypothetical protein